METIQKSIFAALIVALISGLAIGAQASLNSAAGRVTEASLTGLLVNFAGGAAAGLLLLLLFFRQGGAPFAGIQAPTIGIMIASGLLGIGIIAGVTYSLPKIGVTAGLAAIITGQMVVALIVDALGLTGGEPIPLSLTRVVGLALLGLGTWAILSKG